jgi:proline racemase
LTVDTAWGGDSFVIVNAKELGFTLDPSEARDLAVMGIGITKAANEQLTFTHPTIPGWTHFSFCQMAMPVFEENGVLISHNAVAVQPGKIDRSPTGTGVSARMAVLHARGVMKLGDRIRGRSIIGSHFEGRIEQEVMIGDKPGIIPSIAGQAWLTGTHQHMLDPTDPYPLGYLVSDTWPRIGKD